MIARKLLKIFLGVSGLTALLSLVLAQSDVATDPSTGQEYEELFSDSSTNGFVYIDFLSLNPATNQFSCAWFLGAYRFNDGSLSIDLDRTILQSNNLYYAIHYSVAPNSGRAGFSALGGSASGGTPAIFVALCGTNGVVLLQSENLLTSTNVIHYSLSSDAEGQADEGIILVLLPTAQDPDAAIIQTVGRNSIAASDEGESITIHEGLLFTDDGSDLWLSHEQGAGATNSPTVNSLSNYYAWVTGNGSGTNGSSTNNPGGPPPPPPPPPPDGDEEDLKGKIFVDQAKGNDINLGRTAASAKKTVHGGLSIAEPGDTIIIKTGNYSEDLRIQNRDVRVVIEGKVRL